MEEAPIDDDKGSIGVVLRRKVNLTAFLYKILGRNKREIALEDRWRVRCRP